MFESAVGAICCAFVGSWWRYFCEIAFSRVHASNAKYDQSHTKAPLYHVLGALKITTDRKPLAFRIFVFSFSHLTNPHCMHVMHKHLFSRLAALGLLSRQAFNDCNFGWKSSRPRRFVLHPLRLPPRCQNSNSTPTQHQKLKLLSRLSDLRASCIEIDIFINLETQPIGVLATLLRDSEIWR